MYPSRRENHTPLAHSHLSCSTFFELFAKELTQRLLGLGADFTQADSRVRRKKTRAAGERLVKDDVFVFWGVGRPELDGYRPEIFRNNIVYSRLILEKRCMYNIYIYTLMLSFNIYNIDG